MLTTESGWSASGANGTSAAAEPMTAKKIVDKRKIDCKGALHDGIGVPIAFILVAILRLSGGR
jgi:hypothetical protein